MTPSTPDVDHGFEFEREFASDYGSDLVPGSGNQWYAKQDVDGAQMLWQLKSTKDTEKGFRVTPGMIKDTIDAIEAPGGVGGDYMPGWAFRVGGERFVMLRDEDYRRQVIDREHRIVLPESKGEARRRISRVPQLLREET
jgi:hypothetical protein